MTHMIVHESKVTNEELKQDISNAKEDVLSAISTILEQQILAGNNEHSEERDTGYLLGKARF